MPDPFDTDDDWAKLAHELAHDKPPAPPAERVEHPIEAPGDARAEDEAAADGEPEAATDEEFEDAEESPAGEAGDAAEGDQPGTGRKRRRRARERRR